MLDLRGTRAALLLACMCHMCAWTIKAAHLSALDATGLGLRALDLLLRLRAGEVDLALTLATGILHSTHSSFQTW